MLPNMTLEGRKMATTTHTVNHIRVETEEDFAEVAKHKAEWKRRCNPLFSDTALGRWLQEPHRGSEALAHQRDEHANYVHHPPGQATEPDLPSELARQPAAAIKFVSLVLSASTFRSFSAALHPFRFSCAAPSAACFRFMVSSFQGLSPSG
jgi:hypothetical protein